MSRETCLSFEVGQTTGECTLTYWLIALLYNHPMPSHVLPGNDTSLQHHASPQSAKYISRHLPTFCFWLLTATSPLLRLLFLPHVTQ